MSSDYEIALVGALGQRDGILILAGTGSAAYGHTPDRSSARVGGWGYLLGDDGSGYWIGLQALKLLTRQIEQIGWHFEPQSLCAHLVGDLKVTSMTDLLHWVYDPVSAPVQAIAALAPLVLDRADGGDLDAAAIVDSAGQALCQMVQALQTRLDASELPIAFTGGLLSADNALSRALRHLLDLPQRPIARYSPAVGAALLAQLSRKASQSV